jgi:hypothetical protein
MECKPSDSTEVFGLTKAQLLPIVLKAAGEPVVDFSVQIEDEIREHYGGSGDKLIPTFQYLTTNGRLGRVPVFIKRFYKEAANQDEARHYRYLAPLGVGVPRLYGELCDAEGRKLLCLEYVDMLTRATTTRAAYTEAGFMADAKLFPRFLQMLARFNAVKPEAEYAATLRRFTNMWERRLGKGSELLARIWENAITGKLGEAVRELCAANRNAPEHWQRQIEALHAPIDNIQLGLVHCDQAIEHVGQRRETGELVLIDLGDALLAPRFYDAAYWLGAPDQMVTRSAKHDTLAELYLEEYNRWAGDAIKMKEFLEEVNALWIVCVFSMLDWYVHEILDEPWEKTRRNDPEYKRQNEDALYKQLKYLLQC